MRHRVRGRKLGRTSAPRRALLRGLARSLILNDEGRITTTIAKAKELRPFVEKLVTLSREDSDPHRRRALSLLPDKEVVNRLFDDIGPRYGQRPGGYTRILRLDKCLGDKSERALIEFVVDEVLVSGGETSSSETLATIHKPEPSEAAETPAPSGDDAK